LIGYYGVLEVCWCLHRWHWNSAQLLFVVPKIFSPLFTKNFRGRSPKFNKDSSAKGTLTAAPKLPSFTKTEGNIASVEVLDVNDAVDVMCCRGCALNDV
jgi:hypothetical protein